jgi:hypothetical protein
MRVTGLLLLMLVVACGPTEANTGSTGGGSAGTAGGSGGGAAGGVATGGGSTGGSGGGDNYTVFAHSDHVLYRIDLMAKTLVLVGPFDAPLVSGNEDIITDLAVAPNGTLYVISYTTLYTADPNDGHVTKVGALSACGQNSVALTLLPDARMLVADFKGQLCRVNYGVSPLVVTPIAKLSQNMAISGDLVAVRDGTLYGSAYDLADGSGQGTQANNVLVKLNPDTAAVTKMGATGFGRLYGVSYALGKVFGFSHDGSGRVVTVDPMTGAGTLFNTFRDPGTNTPISFAGAGVNALVSPTIN